jgi:protein-disulfide isomerase
MRRALRIGFIAVAALGFASATPAQRNWSATVTQMPSGAFVMGNPAAKVRLVEYLSYTCSHCAHFTTEASAPLKRDYVATGKVAVEVRHLVRDQFDLTAALLARCGGGAKFFGATEAIMADQPVWMASAQLYAVRDAAKDAKLPLGAKLASVARATGLDTIAASQGVTAAQAKACLANPAAHRALLAMTKQAVEVQKIPGTPYFLINGKPGPNTDKWASLEPALKAASGG